MNKVLKEEDTTDYSQFVDQNIEEFLKFSLVSQGRVAAISKQKGEAIFRKRVSSKFNISSVKIVSKNKAKLDGFETVGEFSEEITLHEVLKLCTKKKGHFVKLARVESPFLFNGMVDENDHAKTYHHPFKVNMLVIEVSAPTSAIRTYVFPSIDNDLSENYIKANAQKMEELFNSKANKLSEICLFIKDNVDDDLLMLAYDYDIHQYYSLDENDTSEESNHIRGRVEREFGHILSPVLAQTARICSNGID